MKPLKTCWTVLVCVSDLDSICTASSDYITISEKNDWILYLNTLSRYKIKTTKMKMNQSKLYIYQPLACITDNHIHTRTNIPYRLMYFGLRHILILCTFQVYLPGQCTYFDVLNLMFPDCKRKSHCRQFGIYSLSASCVCVNKLHASFGAWHSMDIVLSFNGYVISALCHIYNDVIYMQVHIHLSVKLTFEMSTARKQRH